MSVFDRVRLAEDLSCAFSLVWLFFIIFPLVIHLLVFFRTLLWVLLMNLFWLHLDQSVGCHGRVVGVFVVKFSHVACARIRV